MKRSVIQLAGKTYVVSLPSKWVKKYNIHKGDELDIIEENSGLKIINGEEQSARKTSINITRFNATLIWHTLLSLYKEGYDEVEVHFENQKTRYEQTGEEIVVLHLLQDIIDYCMGMEIVKHGKNSCVLKDVSGVKSEEFNVLFRRIHFSIINLLNDGNQAIKTQDYGLLKSLTEHSEKNINKIAGTCIRTFNKSDNLPSYLMTLVYNLENLGDCVEKTFLGIASSKNAINEELLRMFGSCLKIFSDYSELFYKNDLNLINELHTNIVHFKAKLGNTKARNVQEYNYVHNILHFMEILTDSIGVGTPNNLQPAQAVQEEN